MNAKIMLEFLLIACSEGDVRQLTMQYKDFLKEKLRSLSVSSVREHNVFHMTDNRTEYSSPL